MARSSWPYRRTSSDHGPLLIVHADDPCYLVNVLGHGVRHAMASSLSALHWASWLSRNIREFEAYADKKLPIPISLPLSLPLPTLVSAAVPSRDNSESFLCYVVAISFSEAGLPRRILLHQPQTSHRRSVSSSPCSVLL